MTLQKLLLIYLAVMNILGFALMGTDKSRARNGKWRIRERTLFLFSLLVNLVSRRRLKQIDMVESLKTVE